MAYNWDVGKARDTEAESYAAVKAAKPLPEGFYFSRLFTGTGSCDVAVGSLAAVANLADKASVGASEQREHGLLCIELKASNDGRCYIPGRVFHDTKSFSHGIIFVFDPADDPRFYCVDLYNLKSFPSLSLLLESSSVVESKLKEEIGCWRDLRAFFASMLENVQPLRVQSRRASVRLPPPQLPPPPKPAILENPRVRRAMEENRAKFPRQQ